MLNSKIKYWSLIFCILFVLVIPYSSFSQNDSNDSLINTLHFLKLAKNRIENDSVALRNFYRKLYLLKKDSVNRVSIVHIGDSHIQADNFSGLLRQQLQIEFGNAGRGLIFPYSQAKTNGQEGYRTPSNAQWDSKRCAFTDQPANIGISGFYIRTADTLATLTLRLRQNLMNYSIRSVKLFYDKSQGAFDLNICDTSGKILSVVKPDKQEAYPFMSSVDFGSDLKQFTIKVVKRDSLQIHLQLYGMELENGQKGILYNTIGVNGAEFKHFNAAIEFWKQLPVLRPDLVIISLGTNDAYRPKFDTAQFIYNIDMMVKNIRNNNPGVCIIMTTPPDSYKKSGKKRYKNPAERQAAEIIRGYCLKNNIACWNFYEIMGGFGSMAHWRAKGLAQYDKIHFTKTGYTIQGILFYQALMNSYKKYELNAIK